MALNSAVATTIGIWLYDAKTYQELDLLKEIGISIYDERGIAFSPDGNILSTSNGSFGGIKLWDIANGTIKKTLLDGIIPKGADDVLFGPDGTTLASYRYKDLFLWVVVTGKNRTINGNTDSVGGFAFSPDGKILTSGNKDQTIILWD